MQKFSYFGVLCKNIGQVSLHVTQASQFRGERERLFGSREREGKLKITFPFYGKGTGIRKLLREGKGGEI